jgi:hypothetical protein
MKSFFTRIQGKFSASFGGRYVETILKEISINENQITKNLFPRIKERGYLETEFSFNIDGRDRIADIVMISEENGRPLAFAELKYDDHNSEHNVAQLEDYIKFCNANSIDFLYLTQYYPQACDLEVVKENKYIHALFSDVAESLMQQKNGALTRLFIEFLRDKGLLMERISEVQVGKLLARLFNPVRGQRVQTNTDMVQSIPENFSALMTNINVISQEMSQYLPTNRNPTIDFFLEPTYTIAPNRLRQILEEAPPGRRNIEITPERNDKNGGNLYIFARSSLGVRYDRNDWSYIEFGFCFSIERGSTKYSSALYSQIYGKYFDGENNTYFPERIDNRDTSDKAQCVKKLKILIVKNIDFVIKKDNSVQDVHKEALNLIKNQMQL